MLLFKNDTFFNVSKYKFWAKNSRFMICEKFRLFYLYLAIF